MTASPAGRHGYILPSKKLLSAAGAYEAWRPSGADLQQSPNPGAEPFIQRVADCDYSCSPCLLPVSPVGTQLGHFLQRGK